MERALEGVRVLDMTRLFPGGYLTTILAQLGAEVVKLEPPGGDPAREEEPRRQGESYYHWAINRGKKSIVIDLKQEPGRDVVLSLVRQADVFLENFRPGVAERLGVDAERLRRVNPQLIYVSLNGFPADDHRSARGSHDLNYLADTGVLDLLGPEHGAPALLLSDLAGAMWGLVTILSLLYQRRVAGHPGQPARVVFAEAIRHWAVLQDALFRFAGETRFPILTWPSYHVYRAADGEYLAVAALEPQFWERFCTTMGRPDWLPRRRDPGWVPVVQEVIGRRPSAYWEGLFAPVDACVTVVRRWADAARRRPDPDLPRPNQWPTAVPETLAPPGLGEHTAELLDRAGWDGEGRRRLRETGAVG
jgi:alpha-methylacyl-CoA racemase